MRIGILGSGLMGGKLGTLFARAGHDVVFSYARSDQKLKRLAREANGNTRAGTPADAARHADALAVHWLRIDDVLQQAGDLAGKILVTCSLPMNAQNTELVVAHSSSGAEELAKKVRKAKVVSAFGTVPSEVFFGVFDAKRRTRRPSMVYCRDDEDAKRVVATLIRDVGFDPVDVGDLRVARYLEPVRSAHGSTRVRARKRSRGRIPIRKIRVMRGGIPQDFPFFEGFVLPELLRATAWPTSALNADASTSSPSWMSIARRTFPSRLELKRRAGSFRDAPFAKVSFTTPL